MISIEATPEITHPELFTVNLRWRKLGEPQNWSVFAEVWPQQMVDELQEILDYVNDPDHYLVLTRVTSYRHFDWVVEHSYLCRKTGEMATCAYTNAGMREMYLGMGLTAGRWRMHSEPSAEMTFEKVSNGPATT